MMSLTSKDKTYIIENCIIDDVNLIYLFNFSSKIEILFIDDFDLPDY